MRHRTGHRRGRGAGPLITLAHPDARLVDAATGAAFAGDDLAARVEAAADAYSHQPPGPAFLLAATELDVVIKYLGALRAGRPITLLDPALPEATRTDLIDRYDPALVLGVRHRPDAVPPTGYRAHPAAGLGQVWSRQAPAAEVHPDLAVLLTTSGSTGSPKLVRLAGSAVLANTESITAALAIDEAQVAVTTLPLFYSFGLSVLQSHLYRGATVVLERTGLMAREFWGAVDQHRVTSLAAVPYQYEMLRRLRFDPTKHPSLRTLTQAGGRLRPELIADFHARITAAGGRMFVMYGQTEAAPRMTTLPAERLAEKIGSVGPAVPGGQLLVRTESGADTTEPGVTGEVIYRGANVMMGYAQTAADLARGDDLAGELATGDLGHLDDDGYLWITGRKARIGKVFGVRVDLDEVERLLTGHGLLAAVPGDDRILIFAEGADQARCTTIRSELADRLGTHSSGLDVRGLAQLPLLATGKVDYQALVRLV